MKIETKFSVGDKVYVIDAANARIKETEVEMVLFSAGANIGQRVSYSIRGENYLNYEEDQIFQTREELIERLSQTD